MNSRDKAVFIAKVYLKTDTQSMKNMKNVTPMLFCT